MWGTDSAIFDNPQTWVASGHLGGFSDPLMDCKEVQGALPRRQLIEDWAPENGVALESPSTAFLSAGDGRLCGRATSIPCPAAASTITTSASSTLMFKTFRASPRCKNTCICAPKPAQGSSSTSIMSSAPPAVSALWRVARIGKSFRNEITTGQLHLPHRELSRWSWSFAASPHDWRFAYWREFCTTGCWVEMKMKTCVCVPTIPRSCAYTPMPPRTLSSCSPSAGVSCGLWRTAPTTT